MVRGQDDPPFPLGVPQNFIKRGEINAPRFSS